MRERKLYSPPERGRAAPSSAYVIAPHSAAMPPTTHSASNAKPEWISSNWNPRLVNTPVPTMFAITTAITVVGRNLLFVVPDTRRIRAWLELPRYRQLRFLV